MPRNLCTGLMLLTLLALSLMLLQGCSQQPVREFTPPVFPPAPAEARFIYDGSLRSSRDISVPSFAEKFREFATGDVIAPLGLAKPFDIVAHNQRIYISDTQQRSVVLFDLAQRLYKNIGEEGPGALVKPLGLALSNQGELYVVDNTARQIVVFDASGQYKRRLGDKLLFQRPTGIAVSHDGARLYVVDTGGIDSDSHHIVELDSQTGALIKRISKRGSAAGELNLPLQIAVGPDGRLYVLDAGNFRVQVFTAEGDYLHQFGSIGRRSGQFSRPKSIAVDAGSRVYVSDAAFGNFQIFSDKGELLLFIGNRGTSGGPARYMLPSGITVDEEGRVYLVDQFFRRVDVFRPTGVSELVNLPNF